MGKDKSRRWGDYFNLFDIIVIILALAAAIFVVMQGEPEPAAEEPAAPDVQEPAEGTVTLHYTMEVSGLEDHMTGAFKVGDELYDRAGKSMGVIESVEVEPATWLVVDYGTSSYVRRESPGQSTVRLRIAAPAVDTPRNLSVEGTVIRVGLSYNLRLPQLLCAGTVTHMERGEDQ